MSLTTVTSTDSTGLSLPPEIILSIFSHLDNKTLKTLRTMNRYLGDIASTILFQKVTLTTPENSTLYKAFGHISQSETLSKLVREMKIKPYGSAYRIFDTAHHVVRNPDFWTSYAMPCMKRFPDLHTLSVHFGEKPPARALSDLSMVLALLQHTPLDSDYETPTEEEYMDVPGQIDDTSRVQLRNVSILNAAPDSVWSKDFETVIDAQELRHLHLELEAAEPGVGLIHYPGYLTADRSLESVSISWLTPSVVENLQTLDIGFKSPWGWAPFVNWRNVGTFPRLKSLTLRKFTFFHESQVDWIASLGSNSGSNGIETLRLDQCQVLYASYLHMSPELLQYERKHEERDYIWTPEEGLVGAKLRSSMDAEQRQVYFRFPMRWHLILQKFQDSMPSLRLFDMEPTGDVKVNKRDFSTTMRRSRLMYSFYRTIKYLLVYEHKNPRVQVRLEEDCKARDEAALDKLIETLLTRRTLDGNRQ